MDADGSDHIHFRSGSTPDWSPDGGQIAYVEDDAGGFRQIRTMASNNSGGSLLTEGPGENSSPSWSPDNEIAFTSSRDGNNEIYAMDDQGDVQTRLTNNPASDHDPDWSPDGRKIAFVSDRDGSREIYVMDADGSNPVRITNTPEHESDPDWQPIPADVPVPASATPLRVPLTPAYEPCSAPNRQHGPGLEEGSCAPPVASAAFATLGPKSTGYARLNVVSESPASFDDADVEIEVSITDVRRRSDGSDLSGALDFTLPLRITDFESGGAGVTPATVVDFNYFTGPALHMPVPCVETPDAATGATCSAESTVDALLPAEFRGRVHGGKRANWALDQLALYDGGEDGVADSFDDNTVLARQGLFVP